ncbi:MAG: lipid biosynthesis B12-binding/radical SAM protein, partial [Verrucomicrobia bacterium A1]
MGPTGRRVTAMKVLLISTNVATTPYPTYPLGLSMIAAAIERAGHEVFQFDFLQHGESVDALIAAIREQKPELVGISIRNIDTTNFFREKRYIDGVKAVVARIREATNARIVLGGSGFSIMPEEILREVGADYGVVGEGESLIADFVTGAAKGEYPSERLLRSEPHLRGGEIPSASYDRGMLDFYLKGGSLASVQTKRGCTHRCAYCSYPVLEGATIREREPAAVVGDIRGLVERHGVKYVFFTDSVFNDDAGHFRAVVDELQKSGPRVPWTAFFKPGGLDDAVIEQMKETGLKAAELGSDASTDTTLRALGKSFLFKDVIECNDQFQRHGVATAHYFMFGGPGETPATVAEGIENLKRLQKTVIFVFMGIRILPGTTLAEIALRDGVIQPDQSLLDPVYYIAPAVDRKWMEEALTKGFEGQRHIVFPPDSFDNALRLLHKMG